MTTTEPGLEDAIIIAQRTTQALPAEMADVLVAELTEDPENRDYAAALAVPDWEQVRTLLHGAYSKHIPAAVVPKTQVLGSVLKGWLRDVPLMAALAMGGETSQKWLLLSAANMPSIADNDIYNPSGQMLQMFYPQMLGDGIITQEQIDAFTTMETPEDWVHRDSRASEVLGMGIVIDVADLVALREAERI